MEFFLLILLLAGQRLNEVTRGNRNLKLHERELVSPLDRSEKTQMLLLHSLWFIAMLAEYAWHGNLVSQNVFVIGILVLLGCQYVRFQTMKVMGDYWTHYPVAFKEQTIVDHGPFTFVRHPNYLAVIVEIALVPLLGSLFWTAAIFTILNLFFLNRRMDMEERSLQKIEGYKKLQMKKKLIPFVFTLALITNVALGDSMKFESKSFKEAKNAPTYFMFKGESTKFGLITTSYEGYAKKGELQFEKTSEKLSNVRLKIASGNIDTDNDMRDEKMRNKCLEPQKYPEITVTIPEISMTTESQTVDGVMTVRGKEVPLKITITKKEDTFNGETSFKLSQTDIPDPSIAIAKVKEKFLIRFQAKL